MSGLRRYAVIGRPVKHSRSPRIHSLFAAQFGLPIEYGLLEPDPDFVTATRKFFKGGGKGLNVTLPFKQEAFEFADNHSSGARQAGAANTLRAEEGGAISACTTDGAGLHRDLRNRHCVELAGQKILVLGAGGAARSIIASLLGERPSLLFIANRTVARASELMKLFAPVDVDDVLESGAIDQAAGAGTFDLIIDATAAGLGADGFLLPQELCSADTVAYSLSYGESAKAFLDRSSACGVKRCFDGLGMLVEQAAFSFAYWERKMPETDSVYAALREEDD